MIMGKIKHFSVLALILLVLAAAVSAIDESDIEIVKVEVNDVDLDEDNFNIERNDEYEVRVVFRSDVTTDNVQVEAELFGHDYDDDLSDVTDVFDIKNDTKYSKRLYINLPQRMDKDIYGLRVRFEDREDGFTETYNFDIDSKNHEMTIKDVVFSPESKVKAGRALLATVRVKNTGDREEESVKIKVSVPELELSASDYIDSVDEDEATTSEELYMRIPSCASAGTYDAVVEVTYHDSDKQVTETEQIVVVEGDTCEIDSADDAEATAGKTIITVGPENQDVVAGEGGVIYPLTLSNTGSATKTYTISANIGDWADVKVSPSNVVVLEGGESKAVYVFVSAKEDVAAGEQIFGLAVKSGDETLKEITLKANVVEEEEDTGSLKKGLEVGLVVLVVLLVILGLIIGFNRLKGDEEDDETEAGQTYY